MSESLTKATTKRKKEKRYERRLLRADAVYWSRERWDIARHRSSLDLSLYYACFSVSVPLHGRTLEFTTLEENKQYLHRARLGYHCQCDVVQSPQFLAFCYLT